VIRLWAADHGDEQGELTRFNEAIDETLAESASQYSGMVSHTREQFLAVLGHDLRNPLAAITAGAMLLSRSDSLDNKHARVATRILDSAERMSRMVSSLLDLARTRLGSSIPIVRKAMNLTTVCQQVIAELEVVYPDHSLRFASEGDLSGEWDGDRLTQVVSNLVANALQYGAASVTVTARALGEEVEFQVHNDGEPIPEGALKTIFEPMVRHADQDGGRNTTGLGLGLFIAREVVAAHCGTLGVASTASEGTTFTVRLPRRAPSGKKRRQSD
jgi:signal transduction histidine kinase